MLLNLSTIQQVNSNSRKICEIYFRSSVGTPEGRHWRRWRRSGVFIDNFKQISHIFDFEQANAS